MNDTAKPLTIYLIAGESSGDLLGAHLMQSLKKLHNGAIRFYGIGGEKMQKEGLKSLFPYHELSMMGFVEILPYIFKLMARIDQTTDDIIVKHPDVVITIDSPGFCFRVVEKLRKRALKFKPKFVHYVAPSVWAYKPERAQKCAKLFDHLLALLPIEPPYFEHVGLPCTWVGHPLVAETQVGDGNRFREKYQIAADVPIFCLLPGSRKGEIERHMPIFAPVMTLLAAKFPNLAIVVPVPPNVMPYVAPYFETCPFRAVVTSEEQERKDAIAASQVAIVKSGTVALEVSMAGIPMVVTYKVNALSAWMFKRMALTRYVNLINIMEGKEIIPELLQELCNPGSIASAVFNLMENPAAREAQKTQQSSALAKFVPPGGERPSDRAARAVLGLI